MPQIYAFALGTLKPKELECMYEGASEWTECTIEQACASPETVYRAVNFFSNWATDEMDLICKPLSDYQPILES